MKNNEKLDKIIELLEGIKYTQERFLNQAKLNIMNEDLNNINWLEHQLKFYRDRIKNLFEPEKKTESEHFKFDAIDAAIGEPILNESGTSPSE